MWVEASDVTRSICVEASDVTNPAWVEVSGLLRKEVLVPLHVTSATH